MSQRIGALLLAGVFAGGVLARPAWSQEGGLRPEQPAVPVEEIIQRFAAREAEFQRARANYVYRQDVTVQELDGAGRVRGEYRMVSDIGFEPDSRRRTETIVYAPLSTLERISLTPQDLQDLREIQPFVLTTEELDLYEIEYQGKEKIDFIDTYVFDVRPKTIEEGERYFEGRIWVDDLDLQIVKTYGKAVPDIREGSEENLFPRFETYREQIDDYWFPTYTRADDTLQFSSGPVRIRQIIRYESYRRFGADVTLSFGDAVEEDPDAEPESPDEEPEEDPAEEPQP